MRALLALVLCAATVDALETRIERDTKLPAGAHRIREPLRVLKDGITLDLGEAVLDGAAEGAAPDTFTGIGLIVEGRKNVTIRGGSLRGFRCAILVRDCEYVVLENIDVGDNFRQRLKSTPEREDPSDWLWPHENDEQQWRKNYGAGICLEDCYRCTVQGCVARRQQNGILLDRCWDCFVCDNDMSFLSGWGLALWRSCSNSVVGNRFDWCVRGYSHGVYARGQDSAGILVFEQSSSNSFVGNSATHGGDGFFLYAGHETLNRTGQGGCNSNLVTRNDFSHAVANAIEATFSRGNRFRKNRCDDSNYGVWAGYSYETSIRGNQIRDNSIAGVAIEHGMDNRIVGNSFEGNPKGVYLWWDDDWDLLRTKFGRTHPCRSEGYHILGNAFRGEKVAISLRETSKVFHRNRYEGVGEELRLEGRCRDIAEASDDVPPPDPLDDLLEILDDLFETMERAELPEGHPRGRRFIMVGEWGPLDPRAAAVYPHRVTAWGSCTFHVLGAEEFAVEGVGGGLSVTKSEHGFRVHGGADGFHAFEGAVVAGERRFPFTGVLLNATWEVGFWKWERDPREPGDPFAGEPAETVKTRRLDFAWKHGGPLGGDRFATLARTRMVLPAGRYEVAVLSDDGVRVLIDGRMVLEDWTHHAPREGKAVVELEEGEHEIVVEHFEIDGYAILRLDLRPLS
jgi:parallel beta-helix repeat protein